MTEIDWSRLSLAVVGGDEREQEIARLAARTGAAVRAYGFPWPEGGIEGVTLTGTVAEAMRDADYTLLPIPRGVEGTLYAPHAAQSIRIGHDLFAPLHTGAHAFCGRVTDALAEASRDLPLTMHEYDPDRELMLVRAAAIVEGALQAAIANTDVTIHHATVAVVGFGNIGSVLARRLLALGADVHVAARNPIQRAAARADGARSLPLEGLPDLASQLSMIFSTVPARVVDRHVLERLPRGSLVLDIVPPPRPIRSGSRGAPGAPGGVGARAGPASPDHGRRQSVARHPQADRRDRVSEGCGSVAREPCGRGVTAEPSRSRRNQFLSPRAARGSPERRAPKGRPSPSSGRPGPRPSPRGHRPG